jgi:hypothetical protein
MTALGAATNNNSTAHSKTLIQTGTLNLICRNNLIIAHCRLEGSVKTLF